MRYRMIVEYDGTPFCGWQSQPDGGAVQDYIEAALAKLGHPGLRLSVAGRTDSGVHAIAQVAHVDITPKEGKVPMVGFRLKEALNAYLRKMGPVCIRRCDEVADDFEARFSARARRYLYRMASRRGPQTFEKGKVWSVPYVLDFDAMAEAAKSFLGTHDFSTFRDGQCEALSPIKTMDVCELHLVNMPTGVEIHAHLQSRSFLHRQVRSMVGSLVEVGRGARPISFIAEILAAADRRACGQVAPPDGLYLSNVIYDDFDAASLLLGPSQN